MPVDNWCAPAIEDVLIDFRPSVLANHIDAMLKSSLTPVALDIESTGLNWMDGKIVLLQLYRFGSTPLIMDMRKWKPSHFRAIGPKLQELFDTCTIVGANLAFDLNWLRWHTGATMCNVWDVMLCDQVLMGKGYSSAEDHNIRFGLKDIAARYELAVSKAERNIFIDMDTKPEWALPLSEDTVRYAAQDVTVLEHIFSRQQLNSRQLRLNIVCVLENMALPAVASIEYNGFHINKEGWKEFIDEKQKIADELEAQLILQLGEEVAKVRVNRFRAKNAIYQDWKIRRAEEEERARVEWDEGEREVDGVEYTNWQSFKKAFMADWRAANPGPNNKPKLETHHEPRTWAEDLVLSPWNELRQVTYKPINVRSSGQILDALKELGVPLTSTRKDAIEALPDGEWPIVDLLKRYRKELMYPQNFGDSLLARIHPKTGNLHPQVRQIGADTGRMSTKEPNFQSTPAKGDGKRLRANVIAEPGNVLITADYPNIELRILAELSGDKNMLKFFAEGLDLHTQTAINMFKLPLGYREEEVKNLTSPKGFKYRDAAKNINFGLMYGMSANRLARILKINKTEAKEIMSAYFALYSGVKVFLDRLRNTAVTRLESRTPLGRARFFRLPEDTKTQDYNKMKAEVERQGMNAPIQGCSADITKYALALLYRRLEGTGGKIVAVVHDEIVVQAPEESARDVAHILSQSMKDSCHKFLKNVHIPDIDYAISDHWEK